MFVTADEWYALSDEERLILMEEEGILPGEDSDETLLILAEYDGLLLQAEDIARYAPPMVPGVSTTEE